MCECVYVLRIVNLFKPFLSEWYYCIFYGNNCFPSRRQQEQTKQRLTGGGVIVVGRGGGWSLPDGPQTPSSACLPRHPHPCKIKSDLSCPQGSDGLNHALTLPRALNKYSKERKRWNESNRRPPVDSPLRLKQQKWDFLACHTHRYVWSHCLLAAITVAHLARHVWHWTTWLTGLSPPFFPHGHTVHKVYLTSRT